VQRRRAIRDVTWTARRSGAGTDRARRRAALGDYEPPPQLPALERGELVARDVV
jgi:hypothetical protein